MSDTAPERFSVAVFPYLKTSAPVKIGGLMFRSTDDTSDLPAAVSECVEQLTAMLFLKDDFRVVSGSYALLPFIDLSDSGDRLDSLRRIQSVIAYCYAAPHQVFGDTFLNVEHATCVVCTPEMVSLLHVQPQHHVTPPPTHLENVMDTVQGLRCLTNFKHHFWATSESRIYPPVPNLGLNISQDLCADFGQSFWGSRSYGALLRMISQSADSVSARILTAIDWFNLSNTMDTGQETALMNLAVAFEALLQLPEGDRKTDRLVDSVALLLGRIPRLDEWVRQFYDARSQIAHEGKAHQLRFVAREGKKSTESLIYHSLLSYGRQVFQLCLSAVLFGSDLARGIGLAEKLVTNQQRFEHLCRILSDEAKSVQDRLEQSAETVYAINKYRFVFESGLEPNTMLGALQLASNALIALPDEVEDEFLLAIKSFANAKRTPDHYEKLDELFRLDAAATSTWQAGVRPSPRHVLLTLIKVVWSYTFQDYFRMKKEQEQVRPPS